MPKNAQYLVVQYVKFTVSYNRILYDIDEGIIKKRVNGKWLDLPSAVNSRSGNSASLNNSVAPSQQNVNYSLSEADETTPTSNPDIRYSLIEVIL